MTMQDANYRYRMEYSQSDGWSGWKDAGQSFYDLATAVHYFHRESSSNRDRIYRVTDMTGDMVYNGKFSAKISGAVLNEETGTASARAMNYFVEYQAEPDWPWMPVIEAGTNNITTGTADQAMALMMQSANQNPGHAHRIKDTAGHIVLDAKPHSIKTQETKEETTTMTYYVQRRKKGASWMAYLFEPNTAIANGTLEEVIAFMDRVHANRPHLEHRVIDEKDNVLAHRPGVAEETSGEPKTETPTMTYIVQWQDKDGKWYLDEDDGFGAGEQAFRRMRELDNKDDESAVRPRRIIASDDTVIAHGCHIPVQPARERSKQKPFWIVTDGRPKTQYSSLAEACMAATTNAGLVMTRYIFQAVRVIDWREEEIGK